MQSSEDLAIHLQSLEEQLLQPEVRRTPTTVATLLADDFREFGSSGRTFTKQQILDELATESPRTIVLADFRCESPTPDVALVTYRTTRTQPRELPFEALRSSLWIYRDHRWQILFHQGTKLTSLADPPQ